jgi:hypothetical protein
VRAWWAGITAACLVSCGNFKIFTGKREKDGPWGPDGRDSMVGGRGVGARCGGMAHQFWIGLFKACLVLHF